MILMKTHAPVILALADRIGHHSGRMLAQQARQKPCIPDREGIGVQLERPRR
jgi:hypothetical protein